MKKIFTLTILIFLAACGTGNTTETRPDPRDFALLEPTTRQEPTATTGGNIQAAQHTRIRILAPAHFSNIIRAAEEQAAANNNLNITIDLVTFNPDTHATYWAENLQNIKANNLNDSFDIFFADPHQPLWQFANNGYLADFYDLINNGSHSTLADYYTQALQALSIGGRLYFFPLGFGLQYVGINTSPHIPQHFIDAFMEMETITVNQMMEMYAEIGRIDTQFTDMWTGLDWTQFILMANCRDVSFPGFKAWHMVNSFVDLSNRTTDLSNPTFIRFLENLMEMYPLAEAIVPEISMAQNFRFNTQRTYVTTGQGGFFASERYLDIAHIWELNRGAFEVGYISTPTTMANAAFRYLFVIHNEFLSPINVFTPFYSQVFDGFIPLVDESGRPKTNMATTFPWKTLCITNNDNAQLSWEFISRYLIPASINRDVTTGPVPITSLLWARPNIGAGSFDTPINRHLTPQHISDILNATKLMGWVEFISDEGNLSETDMFHTVAATDEYGNDVLWMVQRTSLPIKGLQNATPTEAEETIQGAINSINTKHDTALAPKPFVPYDIIEPIVFNMLRRMISTEEAASAIAFAVNQWLATTQ